MSAELDPKALADELAEIIADKEAGNISGEIAATTIGCVVFKHRDTILAALRASCADQTASPVTGIDAMHRLTGRQRLRQIRVKHQLIERREMRAFLAGQISSAGDFEARERAAIADEFDRVFELGFRAGRTALETKEGETDA